MFSYLLTFIISIIFAYIADHNYRKKCLFYLASIMVIFIPSILAGSRDESIGTDVTLYAIPAFQNSLYYNNLYSFLSDTELDSVFVILTYYSKEIFGTFNGLLFLVELFIMIFVYWSLCKMRKYIPIAFGLFVYLFLFYNASLNIMRQHMALAVCLTSFAYAFHEKWKMATILCLLAYLCHGTSFFYALLLILFYISKTTPKYRYIYNLYLVFLPLIFIIVDVALEFAVNIGLVTEKYLMYSTKEQRGGTSYNTFLILMYVLFLFMSYIINKRQCEDKRIYSFSFLSIYSSLLISLLSISSIWLGRLSLYFQVLSTVLLLPYILCNARNINNLKLLKTVFSLFVIMFWVYVVVRTNAGETLPYSSKILGL